jgi:hypothetical protein
MNAVIREEVERLIRRIKVLTGLQRQESDPED